MSVWERRQKSGGKARLSEMLLIHSVSFGLIALIYVSFSKQQVVFFFAGKALCPVCNLYIFEDRLDRHKYYGHGIRKKKRGEKCVSTSHSSRLLVMCCLYLKRLCKAES